MSFTLHKADLEQTVLHLESDRLIDGTQIWKVTVTEDSHVAMIRFFKTFEEAQACYTRVMLDVQREQFEAKAVGPKNWSPRTKRCCCKRKGA